MGTIAQASASALYVSTEAAWGSTAGGNYATARVTSMDLRSRQTNVGSNELSTSREPLPLIRTELSADGSVSFEADVVDSVLEMFLSSLFGKAWSTPLAISAALDVTNVDTTAGTCFWELVSAPFGSVNAGDWVRSAGFVNAANNGVFFVVAKATAASITIANAAAVAETTATTVTVVGSRLVFGSTLVALSMEQKIASVEPLYEQAVGMVARSVSLDLATGAIITGQAQFAGKSLKQSITSMAGTPTAVGTGVIAEAVDHVLLLREGTMQAAETWKVARMSLQLNSPVTPLPALGTINAVGVRVGRPTVTASMSIYVEHGVAETGGVKDLHDAYLAGTQRSGLAVQLGAAGTASNSTYVFMFQRYNITNAGVPVGGNDSDLFLPLEIAAAIDTTIGTAFSVFKV